MVWARYPPDAPMEVDSCWSVASYETLEAVPLELAENFAVGVECRQSVFSSIEDDGWTELKMRDRLVYLQKPSFVRDASFFEYLEKIELYCSRLHLSWERVAFD